jgi:hypothetical protein
MWQSAQIPDILYFVACPIFLVAGLIILLRRRAHWTLGLGLSLLVAVGVGVAWVQHFDPPKIVEPILFFFIVPLSGIFLASQIGIVQRHPWSLLLVGPLFYIASVFLAVNVWIRILVRPV